MALGLSSTVLADNPSPPINKVHSLTDAQRSLLGTWTYTDQDYTSPIGIYWFKLVFNADGTAVVYRRLSLSKNWGDPEGRFLYDVFTGKDPAAGEYFFGVNLRRCGGEDSFVPYQLRFNVEKLVFIVRHPGDGRLYLPLDYGDKFPFPRDGRESDYVWRTTGPDTAGIFALENRVVGHSESQTAGLPVKFDRPTRVRDNNLYGIHPAYSDRN